MRKGADYSKTCIFCGAEKYWNSDITITISGQSFKLGICPKDRNLVTVGEVYIKLASLISEDAHKLVEAPLKAINNPNKSSEEKP